MSGSGLWLAEFREPSQTSHLQSVCCLADVEAIERESNSPAVARSMSVKQQALHFLRRAGLIGIADFARFRWVSRGSGARRAAFARRWGGEPLPPEDIAYDAYGSLDWDFYWGFGRLIGGFLAERIRGFGEGGRVLEWGCGPARIVRHLPALLGPSWDVHASDVNPKTVRWCADHLPAIDFAQNSALPPLPFNAGHFDFVYSVSVFTHLP